MTQKEYNRLRKGVVMIESASSDMKGIEANLVNYALNHLYCMITDINERYPQYKREYDSEYEGQLS